MELLYFKINNWFEILKIEQLLLIAPFTLIYFLLILITRWQVIAKPYINHVRVEIDLLKEDIEEFKQLISTFNVAKPDRVSTLFIEIERQLLLAKNEINKISVLDYLYWSRGQERMAWHYARSADRMFLKIKTAPNLLPEYCTKEKLEVRLNRTLRTLKSFKNPESDEIQKEITKYLTLVDNKTEKDYSLLKGQSLLEEASLVYHNAELQAIRSTNEYNNKAMWVIITALLLITMLGWFLGNPILFLAGAVGGFLSRIGNILKVKNAHNSFDANWMNLFSSPLIGAVAGWSAILLVYVSGAKILNINLFPGNEYIINEENFYQAFGLAIIFGFSEKLFNKLLLMNEVEKIEDDLSPKSDTASPPRPESEVPPASEASIKIDKKQNNKPHPTAHTYVKK